jgi:hypothetical protein
MNAPAQTAEARELALAGMGASRLRKEDARFIQGKGNYVDDIKMAGMLKRVAPISYEAWIDYAVCGQHMSRMEMNALRAMLAGEAVSSDSLGLTNREMAEFTVSLAPRLVPDFNLDLSEAKDAEYFAAQAAAAGKS